MSEHTPGQWRAFKEPVSEALHQYRIGAPGIPPTRSIAHVSLWRDGGRPAYDEGEANARLIVAAPSLLACLRLAVHHLENPGIPIASGSLDNLRAAIAKAEGES